MAAQGRRTDPPLDEVLFEEAYRFDFFQAVRLLERLYPDRQPVGGGAKASDEVVRFRSHLSLSFPPSALYDIRPTQDGEGPVRMTLTFMGLTGPSGVLPRHYTELLLERVRRRDQTLRDFLDLFNHRMLSLFYRAWEKYRFPISYERASRQREGYDPFTLYLFDLIGMGTGGLRGRLEVEDEALLFYAGLAAQHPRSASALAGVLQDYFGVPVAVAQFIGQWYSLPKHHCARLGVGETNIVLGESAIAGNRVWDQHAKFQLRIGPLSFADFLRFLPSGAAFRPLVQLTRFLVGQESDFDVQLILKAVEVPWCRLGGYGEHAPRLGWSTWLKTGECNRHAEDAIFIGQLASRRASPGETLVQE